MDEVGSDADTAGTINNIDGAAVVAPVLPPAEEPVISFDKDEHGFISLAAAAAFILPNRDGGRAGIEVSHPDGTRVLGVIRVQAHSDGGRASCFL